MKYKLLVLDIDDTTLKLRTSSLSDFTLSTLQKVSQLGIKIMVNTGRVLKGIPLDYYKIPLDFASTSNGAMIREIKSNNIISQTLIPSITAFKIFEAVKNTKTYYMAFINDDRYVSETTFQLLPSIRHNPNMKVGLNILPSLSQYILENNIGVEKIPFRYNPEDKEELHDILSNIKDNILITSSEYGNFEVNDINANKGNAVLKICNYLNIKQEEVIICGDNGNDISMLQLNGFKIVPLNGTEDAKQYANIIADTCENDGIAKALTQILNI